MASMETRLARGAARMETRLARGAARDAEADWKRHAKNCPRCSRSMRDRHTEPCRIGGPLRDDARELRAKARREGELDKMPAPGQEPLF